MEGRHCSSLQQRVITAGSYCNPAESGDRALLLPGGTHAGKSSLVAERCVAAPLTSPMNMRDRFRRARAPIPAASAGQERPPGAGFDASERVQRFGRRESGSRRLDFFPSYLSGCVWNVGPITQSEAVLTLLRNTPHILAESPQMVRVFERAVAGATSYAGRRNEAADAVDHILRLLDRSE
jgi:hypothetical protein